MGPVRYGAFHAGRSSLQIWYGAYLMACAPDCPCQFDHTVYIKPQQLYLLAIRPVDMWPADMVQ